MCVCVCLCNIKKDRYLIKVINIKITKTINIPKHEFKKTTYVTTLFIFVINPIPEKFKSS
ncbi:hypothetical protein Hanom_Chr07g00589811 [Helianthus anomalus]